MELICHPAALAKDSLSLHVTCTLASKNTLNLCYTLEGTSNDLRIPQPGAGGRADGLWKHTCFEAFVGLEGAAAYHEFNFAPSGEWAIYRFAGYREGMTPVTPAMAPQITVHKEKQRLMLETMIELDAIRAPAVEGSLRVALAAVIEAGDGSLSCWALRHAPGKPDFHHPDSYAMTL
jgi:hypothetical protein